MMSLHVPWHGRPVFRFSDERNIFYINQVDLSRWCVNLDCLIPKSRFFEQAISNPFSKQELRYR
jgi:hypothetical protein